MDLEAASSPISVHSSSNGWNIAFCRDNESVGTPAPLPGVHIRSISDFSTLRAALREVRLKGDASVKIYEQARIQMERVRIDCITPIATYLLRSQIAVHTKMYWTLQAIELTLFDLQGMLDYTIADTPYRMVPPIIETYQEPTTGRWVSAIIDGLHRIWAARNLGFDELWVVRISHLPVALPPIALPVMWNELALYDDIASVKTKRHYRFNPAHIGQTPNELGLTAENCQYFLYRDFAALGSNGIRT